jgi:hypothetical protein
MSIFFVLLLSSPSKDIKHYFTQLYPFYINLNIFHITFPITFLLHILHILHCFTLTHYYITFIYKIPTTSHTSYTIPTHAPRYHITSTLTTHRHYHTTLIHYHFLFHTQHTPLITHTTTFRQYHRIYTTTLPFHTHTTHTHPIPTQMARLYHPITLP